MRHARKCTFPYGQTNQGADPRIWTEIANIGKTGIRTQTAVIDRRTLSPATRPKTSPRYNRTEAPPPCSECSGSALFQLRRYPASRHGFYGHMFQMRCCFALLQAVRKLRFLYQVSMPQTDTGADSNEGPGKYLRAIFVSRDRGA